MAQFQSGPPQSTNATGTSSNQGSEFNGQFRYPVRTVGAVAVVVTVLCVYRLIVVAAETGNMRGAWFSVVHLVVVAVGALVSLCGSTPIASQAARTAQPTEKS
jgi:hypothetical protein